MRDYSLSRDPNVLSVGFCTLSTLHIRYILLAKLLRDNTRLANIKDLNPEFLRGRKGNTIQLWFGISCSRKQDSCITYNRQQSETDARENEQLDCAGALDLYVNY